MLILCYMRMLLFQIENQWCYKLKMSEPQVHQLNKSHLEGFKMLKLQKMSRESVLQFSTYSARKYTYALGLSD